MAIYKNKASQKLAVFAYDSTDGSAKTGDAANITAQISLDGGATAATNDTNPTELDATDAPGIYLFDATQAETSADLIVLAPVSATANILLEPMIIYTEPETRSADVTQVGGVTQSATDLKDFVDTGYDPSTHKVQGVVLTDTCTTNTDMRGTDGANTTVPDAAGTAATLIGVAGAGLTAVQISGTKKTLDALNDATQLVQRAEPDNASITSIKAKTDGLNFTGTDVKATLDGETVTASSVTDKTDYALTAAYDDAKTAAQAGDAMTLTGVYDAAKTAATQTSVNTIDGIVDEILIDTAVIGALGAGLTALAPASTALSSAVWTNTKAGYIDAAISEAGGGGGGDATAENQTAIIAHLTGIKGTTWSGTTDSLEAIRDRGDAAWTTGAVSEDKAVVDHDTGGTDALRYVDGDGNGISGATIRAYLTVDYDAGTYTLRATTTTGDDGRWTSPLYLDHEEDYTLVYEKSGEYGPDAEEITTE